MAGARRRQTVGGFPVGSWGPLGVAAAATANLDLDAQEAGQDTLAAELAVLVQASLQVQEAGADTAAGTASVLVQLVLQAQDGADTAAMAASVQVQAALAAQDAPDTMQATVTAGGAEPEPEPAPGGGGGSWGTGPSHRVVTHYAKEYPEDARTPVARAAAEAVEPIDAEAGEQPLAAGRLARPRRATVFTPPAPSAEALLLAEVLVLQQADLLLAAQVQADLLAIEALRAAAMAREEEEAIELFLLLEA